MACFTIYEKKQDQKPILCISFGWSSQSIFFGNKLKIIAFLHTNMQLYPGTLIHSMSGHAPSVMGVFSKPVVNFTNILRAAFT